MPNLYEKVTGPIENCLGFKLSRASYDCPDSETDGTDLEDSNFYFAGQVHLVFDETRSVVVSWDKDVGWGTDSIFSLEVAEVSLFTPEGMRSWPMEKRYPWSSVVGNRLVEARVYGDYDTPFFVGFTFDNNKTILAGTGWKESFGEGDDVLVRSSENMIGLSDWEVLWSGFAT